MNGVLIVLQHFLATLIIQLKYISIEIKGMALVLYKLYCKLQYDNNNNNSNNDTYNHNHNNNPYNNNNYTVSIILYTPFEQFDTKLV